MANVDVAAAQPRFQLVDDGTLDTVYACIRCGTCFHEWILKDAEETHKCPPERAILDLIKRMQECANDLERVFLRRGTDSPYFTYATRVDAILRDMQAHEESRGIEF